MEHIYGELEKLGISNRESNKIEEIRNQNGIFLYRVKDNVESYVLKYFENEEFKREIKNYRLMQQLNIPTIQVLGTTESSLLLEDLEKSKDYRLGVAEDLLDVKVARALAKWYKILHKEGAQYIKENKCSFYREIDAITKENIQLIIMKSNTQGLIVWDLILDNFHILWEKINSCEETLTYNDFYWTNLTVARNGEEALMFDYNFLGSGFRYNDLRNVCSSLSPEAGKVFIEEYGGVDIVEKTIDEVTCILFDLITAYQRNTFPQWAQSSLDAVQNGELEKAFKRVLEL